MMGERDVRIEGQLLLDILDMMYDGNSCGIKHVYYSDPIKRIEAMLGGAEYLHTMSEGSIVTTTALLLTFQHPDWDGDIDTIMIISELPPLPTKPPFTIEPLKNENGITVTELKEWLEAFPQDFDFDEEENSVWMGCGKGRENKGLSNPVTKAYRLNASDVIFEMYDKQQEV